VDTAADQISKPPGRDDACAEAYGRVLLGTAEWVPTIFDHVDGGDNMTKGYLLPAEWATMVELLQRELGRPPRGKRCSRNFTDADIDVDGRVSYKEWVSYSRLWEEAYGYRRCKRAVMRIIGTSQAEARKLVLVEGNKVGIYMFDGFNPTASLSLIRTCTKWRTQSGLLQKAQQLLEQKADPNCGLADPSFNGYTPLIFLAIAHPQIPKDQKTPIDLSFSQKTPIDQISSGISKVMELLIAKNADLHRPNEPMPFGRWTPLRFAAQNQSRPGVATLLKHIDVGERFLWAAGENVQHVMLEELSRITSLATCKRITQMDVFDNYATILLLRFSSEWFPGELTANGAHKLCSGLSDDHEMLEPDAKADPNGAGLGGVTALMNVIRQGDVETARALIDGRASPAQCDSGGATPLHLAAACVQPEIVSLLLDANAELHVMDHAGFTPWMVVGELCTILGGVEKARIQDLLNELAPEVTPGDALDLMEKDWESIFADGTCKTTQDLGRRFRLQESLFFQPGVGCRYRTHECRRPSEQYIARASTIMMNLLRTDPLTGDMKTLCRYLLESTKGPSASVKCTHVAAVFFPSSVSL
jgi:ankyrin repeat protein